MHVTIAQTWDGKRLSPEAQVDLWIEPRADGLQIRVEAPYGGDEGPPGEARSFWGLWEYEVVEVFILGEGACYTEIELSPHGHHLVLQLEGERHVVTRELPLDYAAQIDGQRWSGVARLDWRYLPEPPHRLNAYAIRGVGEGRVYHAFSPMHGGSPDFHHLECFRSVGGALAATASES